MNNLPINPLSCATEGAGGPTGTWRSHRPVIDSAKCTGCLLCWIWCPEGVIAKADRSVNYDYCKGCGLCAKECPAHAITMIKEADHE